MSTRGYTLREERWLSEYAAMAFPNARVLVNQRLGSGPPVPRGVEPTASTIQYLNNRRRFADLIVIEPKFLIVVEGKIVAEPGIISQLDLYAMLVPLTPELAQFKHLAVRKMLVTAVTDETMTALARKYGIEVKVYSPQWVIDDLRSKYGDRLRMTTPSYIPPEVLK